MRRLPRRGARATAPLALVVLAATACGGSPHHATSQSGPTTAPSTPAAATTDAATTGLLAAAERTLGRDRSYRFDALETVAASTPVTTRLSGTVVRTSGVSYTLTAGHTRTQVVRVRTATYVRKVPGRWAKLRSATPVADPTASLLALLRGLAGATSSGRSTVSGTLSGAAARSAGIPTDGSPARVRLTIDRAGHVTDVSVRTSTAAAGKAVAVTLVSTYSAFDRTASLRPPV